jgi:hypothetical protein
MQQNYHEATNHTFYMVNCSLIKVHHYLENIRDQIKHYVFTGTHEELNFRGSSTIQTRKKTICIKPGIHSDSKI